MSNIATMTAKIKLDASGSIKDLLSQFGEMQKAADKNFITYKITGDKKQLDEMLKQVKGLDPSVNIHFLADRSGFDKTMDDMKKLSGKSAKEIQNSFKNDSAGNSFISKIIGNEKDAEKIRKSLVTELNNIRRETKDIQLDSLTDYNSVSEYTIKLQQMSSILSELSRNSKKYKIDNNILNIGGRNTLQLDDEIGRIESLSASASQKIAQNLASWIPELQTQFDSEFKMLQNWISSIGSTVGQSFGQAFGEGVSGEVNKAIQEAESNLSRLEGELSELENKLNTVKNQKPTNTKTFNASESVEMNNSLEKVRQSMISKEYSDKSVTEFAKAFQDAIKSGMQLQAINRNIVDEYKELSKDSFFKGLGIIPIDKITESNNGLKDTQKIIDEISSQITAKKQEIADVVANIERLRAESSGTGNGNGAGNGNGTGNGNGLILNGESAEVSVKPSIDANEFISEVNKQLKESGLKTEVDVTGKVLSPETFKTDVETSIAEQKVNIDTNGTVSDINAFASSVTEKLKEVKAEIDVVAKNITIDGEKSNLNFGLSEKALDDLKSVLKDFQDSVSKSGNSNGTTDEELQKQIKKLESELDTLKSKTKETADVSEKEVVDLSGLIDQISEKIKDVFSQDGLTIKINDDQLNNLKTTLNEIKAAIEAINSIEVKPKIDNVSIDNNGQSELKVETVSQASSTPPVVEQKKEAETEAEITKEEEKQNGQLEKKLKTVKEINAEIKKEEESMASNNEKIGEVNVKRDKLSTSSKQYQDYKWVVDNKFKELNTKEDFLQKALEKLKDANSKTGKSETKLSDFTKAATYYDKYLEMGGTEKAIYEKADFSSNLIQHLKSVKEINNELDNGNIKIGEQLKKYDDELVALKGANEEHKTNIDLLKKELTEARSREAKARKTNKPKAEVEKPKSEPEKVENETLTTLNNLKVQLEQAYAEDKTLSTKAGTEAALEFLKAYKNAIESNKINIDEANKFNGILSKISNEDISDKVKSSAYLKTLAGAGIDSFQEKLDKINNPEEPKVVGEGKVNLEPTINELEFVTTANALLDNIKLEKKVELLPSNETTVSNVATQTTDAFNSEEHAAENATNQIKSNKEALIELLNELKILQDTIKNGNQFILPQYENGVLQDHYGNQIRQGFTTKKSIQDALNHYNDIKSQINSGSDRYNEDSLNRALNDLTKYVAAYKSLDEAETIFGKKNQDVWQQVVDTIERAKAAKEAYDKYDARDSLVKKYLNTDSITYGDLDKVAKNLKNGDVESAFNYLVEKYGLIEDASRNAADQQISDAKRLKEAQTQANNQQPLKDSFQGGVSSGSSMQYEVEDAEKLRAKLVEVTTAVDAKTRAFQEEEQIVAGTVQNEVTNLEVLDGQLFEIEKSIGSLISEIERLRQIPIEFNINSESIDESLKEALMSLTNSVNGIDPEKLKLLSENFSSKLFGNNKDGNNSVALNIQKIANAILNLKSALNNVGTGGNTLLSDIKSIISKSDEIKSLATILSSTKKEIEEAKKAVNAKSDKPKEKTQTQKSNEQYGVILNYEKEIAKLTKLQISSDDTKRINAQKRINEYRTLIEQAEQVIKNDKLENQAKESSIKIIRDQISLQEQLNERILEQRSEREAMAEATSTIDLNALMGGTWDIDVLKELDGLDDEWLKAITAAHSYVDVLGDVVDITRKIVRNQNGEYDESYVITGKDGNKITKGLNGDYLMSSQKVVDDLSKTKELDSLYKSLNSQLDQNLKLQKSIANGDNSKTTSNALLQNESRILEIDERINQLKQEGIINDEQAIAVSNKRKAIEKDMADITKGQTNNQKKDQIKQWTSEIVGYYKKIATLTKSLPNEGAEEAEITKKVIKALKERIRYREEAAAIRYGENAFNRSQRQSINDAKTGLDRVEAKISDDNIKQWAKAQEEEYNATENRYRRERELAQAEGLRQEQEWRKESDSYVQFWEHALEQREVRERETNRRINEQNVQSQQRIQQNRDVDEMNARNDYNATEQADYYETLIYFSRQYAQALREEAQARNEADAENARTRQGTINGNINNLRNDMNANGIAIDTDRELESMRIINQAEEELEANRQRRRNQAEQRTAEQMAHEQAREYEAEERRYQREREAALRIGQQQAQESQRQTDNYVQFWENALNRRELAEREAIQRTAQQQDREAQREAESYVRFWEHALEQRELKEREAIQKSNRNIDSKIQQDYYDTLIFYSQRYVTALKAEAAALNENDKAIAKSIKRHYAKETKNLRREMSANNISVNPTQEIKNTDIINKGVSDTNKISSEAAKKIEEQQKRISIAIANTTHSLKYLQGIGSGQIFKDTFSIASLQIESLNTQLENGEIDLTTYKNKVGELFDIIRDSKDIVKVFDNPISYEQAIEEMDNYAQSLSKTKDMSHDVVTNLNGDVKEITYSWTEDGNKVHQVKVEYDELNGVLRATNLKEHTKDVKENASWIQKLGYKWQDLLRYLASFASFYQIWAWVKQGASYVKELDTALTEMRKVSDESVESLKNFQSVSFDIAHNIGSTAAQIQNSAADFMRLGYSLQEASQLAEDANIYANVGDMEIEEATEHMISSIKAWGSEFNSEVEASGAIIDKYNEIGNNFAITSADIGEAMERSAAALKAGGNTLDESLGLITAGNLINQDAESTANALKVMSLRIRGSKTDLEEMGESTDDLASSTSKLREEIKQLTGVDIMADENTYKSTAKIIQEIGAIWDQLDDISQANVLEKLAGKTRASVAAGLLENYTTIQDVIDNAQKSEGSAREENERYMNSIEGKLEQLSNAAQEFWYNFLNSDTVKVALDLATKLLNILNETVGKTGAVTTGIGAIGFSVARFLLKSNKDGNSGGRAKIYA